MTDKLPLVKERLDEFCFWADDQVDEDVVITRGNAIKVIKELIQELNSDRKEYDLKVKSDTHGYLSGLAWFGRCKPNTIYNVYIEEVKETE